MVTPGRAEPEIDQRKQLLDLATQGEIEEATREMRVASSRASIGSRAGVQRLDWPAAERQAS